MEDVQDLLEEAARCLPADCSTCLHDRPFFHTLLPDIDSAMASQSQESLATPPPQTAGGSERKRRHSSREGGSEGDSEVRGLGRGRGGGHQGDDDSMDQVMCLDDLMD